MEDYSKQDYFKTASTDSMTWLENAEFLKISADLMYENVMSTYKLFKEEQRRPNPNFVLGGINRKRVEIVFLEDKLKSYYKSYYLLVGYAFENLIKGLSLKNNPAIPYEEIYRKNWRNYKHGHGISGICIDNLTLMQDESELLEKLEAFILWLGKYPVALNMNDHVAEYELRGFDSGHKLKIDSLFDKIKEELEK